MLFDNDVQKEFKLLSILSILTIVLITLGSSNSMYNAISGMWVSLSLMMFYIYKRDKIIYKDVVLIDTKELLLLKKFFIVITIVLSLVIHYYNIYRDSHDRTSLIYPIDNDKLMGVYTTKERAHLVEEFLDKLEYKLKDRELFISGKISTVYYLLNKPAPLKHIWAVSVMNKKYFKNDFNIYASDRLPVIARAKYSVSTHKWPYDKIELFYGGARVDNTKVVQKFIKEYHYKVVWENEYFEILDYK
jgi:hypothetical protein